MEVLDIIAKAINILLISILIIVIIFGLILLIQNNKFFVFDIKSVIIISESMEPTLCVGDIIFVENTGDYSIGDIITFEGNGKRLITHRIVEVFEGNRGNVYKTKGDNNAENDWGSIYEYNIIGEIKGKTSLIRNVFQIITNKFVIIFVVLFYIIYLNKRKKKL